MRVNLTANEPAENGQHSTARTTKPGILFLSMGSPWPPHSGAAMRSWGILRQLAMRYEVTLVLLSGVSLAHSQQEHLRPLVTELVVGKMRDRGLYNRLWIVMRMALQGLPYHAALLRHSLSREPEIGRTLRDWQGIVISNVGHWGTFVLQSRWPKRWILNQCDADIQFWDAYAAQARGGLRKLAARINYLLARHHFPAIYQTVGAVVAVSEEDKAATLPYAVDTPVFIVRNGVDMPANPKADADFSDGKQLIFTGTAAPRNLTALHDFIDGVLPLVLARIADVKLVVAGNFPPDKQAQFDYAPQVSFTGRVDDLTGFLRGADIFVSPFRDAHGSKLKVAEAMSMGLPVVSTRAGVRGFPVVHGETALIADNDAQFAEYVCRLIANPKERNRIGANAYMFAQEHLDWNVLGEELATHIDHLSDENNESDVHP